MSISFLIWKHLNKWFTLHCLSNHWVCSSTFCSNRSTSAPKPQPRPWQRRDNSDRESDLFLSAKVPKCRSDFVLAPQSTFLVQKWQPELLSHCREGFRFQSTFGRFSPKPTKPAKSSKLLFSWILWKLIYSILKTEAVHNV